MQPNFKIKFLEIQKIQELNGFQKQISVFTQIMNGDQAIFIKIIKNEYLFLVKTQINKQLVALKLEQYIFLTLIVMILGIISNQDLIIYITNKI